MSIHPRMGKQSKDSVQIHCDELMSWFYLHDHRWLKGQTTGSLSNYRRWSRWRIPSIEWVTDKDLDYWRVLWAIQELLQDLGASASSRLLPSCIMTGRRGSGEGLVEKVWELLQPSCFLVSEHDPRRVSWQYSAAFFQDGTGLVQSEGNRLATAIYRASLNKDNRWSSEVFQIVLGGLKALGTYNAGGNLL